MFTNSNYRKTSRMRQFDDGFWAKSSFPPTYGLDATVLLSESVTPNLNQDALNGAKQ